MPVNMTNLLHAVFPPPKLASASACKLSRTCGGHRATTNQLADVLAGVRHRDLIDLIRIQPDFTLAALEDRGGEALLQTKRHHP